LHAVDLGADEGGDFIYFGLSFGKQVGKAGIGIFAVVVVLKGFQRRVSSNDVKTCSL
jgi:hypothetical protein